MSERSMREVVARVLRDYPEVLENMHRTNAILLDLAHEMPRERILVRSFVEAGGFSALKNATDAGFPLAEKKLVQTMKDTFSMEHAAAAWVVRLFGAVLGHVGEEELHVLHAGGADSKAPEQIARLVSPYSQGLVSIGKKHVVALSPDGTVFAGGDNSEFQCDVHGWTDIVAVAAGEAHTLGLRSDGKVLATGSNAFDECDVGFLSDIRAVYAFGNDSICVKNDGTALAFGKSRLDLSTFSEIVGVARFPEGLVGIRADGTLAIVGSISDDDAAQEIAWLLSCHDVEQVICTYNSGCVILGRDKRIYKSNQAANYFTQWREVESIADLADCFAILRTDGTVRVLPYDREKTRPETDAEKWRDIVAIFGGYRRLIGLTRDGRLRVAYTHQGWLWSNQAMLMDYVSAWEPVGKP